jgi:hypothetical protein
VLWRGAEKETETPAALRPFRSRTTSADRRALLKLGA